MIMDNLKLSEFNSISLKDLDKVQLLNRKDTKFVFSQNKLLQLLDRLKPLYRILEIEGKRTFVYDNTYFDTDEFFFILSTTMNAGNVLRFGIENIVRPKSNTSKLKLRIIKTGQ